MLPEPRQLQQQQQQQQQLSAASGLSAEQLPTRERRCGPRGKKLSTRRQRQGFRGRRPTNRTRALIERLRRRLAVAARILLELSAPNPRKRARAHLAGRRNPPRACGLAPKTADAVSTLRSAGVKRSAARRKTTGQRRTEGCEPIARESAPNCEELIYYTLRVDRQRAFISRRMHGVGSRATIIVFLGDDRQHPRKQVRARGRDSARSANTVADWRLLLKIVALTTTDQLA